MVTVEPCMDVTEMIDGYLAAALFTADEDVVPPQSGDFTQRPDYGDLRRRIVQAARHEAARVCTEFYLANAADLVGYPAFSAGSDLWYTRNHHGVGFWEADHCTPEQGDRLTAAAHRLGEVHVYRQRGWFYIERC